MMTEEDHAPRGLGNVTPDQMREFDAALRALMSESPLFQGEITLEQFALRLLMAPLRMCHEASQQNANGDERLVEGSLVRLIGVALDATLFAAKMTPIIQAEMRKRAH